MNSGRHTVLVDPRPVRFAFLIDLDAFPLRSSRFFAIIDAVIAFNNVHWGGRANTLVPFSGQRLDDRHWQLLKAQDPDRLVVFAPLSNELLEKLDEQLSPCEIHLDDQTRKDEVRFAVQLEGGIGVPPTADNYRAAHPGHLSALTQEDPRLVVFGFGEGCDQDVQRFLLWNFGTYDQWLDPKTKAVRRNIGLEKMLVDINAINYTVTDIRSLSNVITEMSGRNLPSDFRRPLPFIAPYQLSSIYLEHSPWREFQDTYQIIVGDSPQDILEHWNGAIWKRNLVAPHSRQLWVPKGLILNSEFRSSLRDWITRYRQWDGGWRVEIISQSLAMEEVAQILSDYRQGQQVLPIDFIAPERAAARFDEVMNKRTQERRFIPWTSDDDVLRLSASSPEDRLSLPFAHPLAVTQGTGTWMVDVQLEHRDHKQNRPREQAWWHLPKTRNAGWPRAIFRASARVNAEGRFAVEVESRNQLYSRRERPTLKLQIPSASSLIHGIVVPAFRRPFAPGDARSALPTPSPSLERCRVSTKGYYLSALLDLFGDFWTAKSFCERRFWRELFAELAGHGLGDDDALRRKVAAILAAQLPGTDPDRAQQAKSLSDEILHLVRGRLQGHYLEFRDLLQRRGKLEKERVPDPLVYPQGRTIVHHGGLQPVSVAEMEEGLNRLMTLDVLRVGVLVDCPHCKISTWFQVDTLLQKTTCSGCGGFHTLRARERWSYGLNSLAQMSVSQGVLGALHALTALHSSNIHSFFAFSPSLDLFRPGDTQPWHEIDIACVADGDFVIGEAKEGFVQKSDFDNLAEIAEVLRPDRAILFLPFEHASKQRAELDRWFADTRARFDAAAVSFELFTLPAF